MKKSHAKLAFLLLVFCLLVGQAALTTKATDDPFSIFGVGGVIALAIILFALRKTVITALGGAIAAIEKEEKTESQNLED